MQLAGVEPKEEILTCGRLRGRPQLKRKLLGGANTADPLAKHRAAILVVGAVVASLAAALNVPTWLRATLPLTAAIAADGGTWRVTELPGRGTMNVVVHRKERWCQCPGLGVAAQLANAGADSAVVLANALFEAFLGEAAQEPEPRRCLTVTLEVGAGRHWPWVRPSHYALAIWRRQTDDR